MCNLQMPNGTTTAVQVAILPLKNIRVQASAENKCAGEKNEQRTKQAHYRHVSRCTQRVRWHQAPPTQSRLTPHPRTESSLMYHTPKHYRTFWGVLGVRGLGLGRVLRYMGMWQSHTVEFRVVGGVHVYSFSMTTWSVGVQHQSSV